MGRGQSRECRHDYGFCGVLVSHCWIMCVDETSIGRVEEIVMSSVLDTRGRGLYRQITQINLMAPNNFLDTVISE